MEFGEMKRNTSNWVWQRQLGFLVCFHSAKV